MRQRFGGLFLLRFSLLGYVSVRSSAEGLRFPGYLGASPALYSA